MTPKSLYRTVSIAETFTWALLLLGMALKYSGTTEALMPFVGGIHGFVFLSFCVSTVLIWVNNQWTVGRGILGLASAFVPFATIPFDRNTEREGLLDGQWRFRDPQGPPPRALPEKVLALCVNRPLIAAAITVVALVIVFVSLLALGSPADWGK